MITTFSVGEEIDSWCTKCKLELGHTIVAMVDNLPKKVKCNTCNGTHVYRMKPAVRSTTSKSTTRKTKAKDKEYVKYLALLAKNDHPNAKKYNIAGNFEAEDVISHSKFGTGVVTDIVNTNKIKVFFNDGLKLLIQNHT